jgi:hypothetical protein
MGFERVVVNSLERVVVFSDGWCMVSAALAVRGAQQR